MSTRLKNVSRKVKEWPSDWDLHVLNTCEFYFENNQTPIELVDGASIYNYIVGPHMDFEALREELDKRGIEVRMLFYVEEEEENYGSAIRYSGGKSVEAIVFKLIKGRISVDEEGKKIVIVGENERAASPPEKNNHTIMLINKIGFTKCRSAYKCVENIERIIMDHFNSDGGEDNDPVPEPDPVDSFSLDPDLVEA